MNFNDYQKQSLTTAIFHKDKLMDKTIWAMGVSGEAGEVIEKWKKIVAYKDGKISDEDLKEISKELGDVLWYVALFAHSLGLSLDDIAKQNIEKLQSRKQRGVTKGSGDNR